MMELAQKYCNKRQSVLNPLAINNFSPVPLDTQSSGFLLFAESGTLLDTLIEHGGIRLYGIISLNSMGNDLKPYENIMRVFWIKIELNDNHGKDMQHFGDIKDVMSGKKSPIYDLLDIIIFIVPYMRQMGIRIGWFWELTTWMKRGNKIT